MVEFNGLQVTYISILPTIGFCVWDVVKGARSREQYVSNVYEYTEDYLWAHKPTCETVDGRSKIKILYMN